MFTQKDLHQLNEKGISEPTIALQLKQFANGFPYLPLQGSAQAGQGILQLEPEAAIRLQTEWDTFLKAGGRVVKFVPASGAASRMFKDLFEFLEAETDIPATPFMQQFFQQIDRFAFFEALNTSCLKNEGTDIATLLVHSNYKAVVRNLLDAKGLNYGALPKGLLLFHRYPDGSRKAVAEHLVEGALYAKTGAGDVSIHFTVSPEHLSLFKAAVKEASPVIEKAFNVRFNIGYSVQKPSTDTIAADASNQPFRENGKLVFRPGGHGALIENLNDLEADVVFIKNIDNVVPDRLKETTVTAKKTLAGLLVSLQQKTFNYLKKLDSGHYTHDELLEIIQFLQRELCTRNPETKVFEDAELVIYLKNKLDRPIRVCGMVRNQGEPGGGPFWAFNNDGSYSLQILESSQIDLKDPDKKALFEQGTHFNPVDLVCAIRDYQGNPFNLPDFVDQQTGFISKKSKNGKDLQALELPGLWNGAMSDWNTVFVEVPLITFNPVKTVNDLLRPEHQ